MTSARVAFILVDLAKLTAGSRRTGAGEVVDQVVTNTSVSTRVGLAVVDVVFTLGAHVAWSTCAAELGLEVVARSSVQAGVGGASIGLVLAVGSPVAFSAVTCV